MAKQTIVQVLGRWGSALMEEGLTSYGLGLFTRVLGKTPAEANELCKSSVAEMRRRDVHTYGAQ